MLTALVVLLRSIGLLCRGHRAVALENVALRQQLAVLTRTVKRPQLRRRDRLFWILVPSENAVLLAVVDVAVDDGYAFEPCNRCSSRSS
jgi:hypothetical protein